tara:strand:- start:94576 stop:96171 length:1596 start_codon:yes stop_codon:yes gene_type:complete
MLFTHHIDALVSKYAADPASIHIEDIIPLIDYIEQQSIHIPDHIKPQLQKTGENNVGEEIRATTLIHGRAQGTSQKTRKAAILTIGVHGNEIYAGAICALEVLKAQKQGKLEGDVVLQLGNIKAIRGYLDNYDPNIFYTARAGWRCTNGTELAAQTITLDDGSALEVKDDMNRVPKRSMALPRGVNPNIDRAQDIVWTARALEQNLLPDGQGILSQAPYKVDTRFILHPHTSRSPNGITNLSLPAKSRAALANGEFGKPFIHTPPYMMNIIQWLGTGLGGGDNYTMTRLVSEEINDKTLVVTAELGNHEDVKTPTAPSLITTSQHFTAGLMESRGVSEASHLKNAYNLSANTHSFKYYEAQVGKMQLRYLDGFSQIEQGDSIYPVRQMDQTERNTLAALHIAKNVITVDDTGQIEIFDEQTAPQNHAKIKNAKHAYYQAFPLDLEEVKAGETLFLNVKKDGATQPLNATQDFHAIFAWPMRGYFPCSYDAAQHSDMKIYNISTSVHDVLMPDVQRGQQKGAQTAPPQKPQP